MKAGSSFQLCAALGLALVLVAGSVEFHADAHEPGIRTGPTEVFASARHLRDAAHLEAAGAAVERVCPACVLLKSPREIALPCRSAQPAIPSRSLYPYAVAARQESRPWGRTPRGPPPS